MTEEQTTTVTGDLGGQLGEGPDGSSTTQAGTEGTEGQTAEVSTGTTDTGTQTQTTETFFNPQTIVDVADMSAIQADPNLSAAYKQMQRAFGTKMDGIKENQQKIDAFNAFNQDPVGTLQNYAKQYGYNLTRVDAAQALEQGQPNSEPQTWDEVYQRASEHIMKELAPHLGELQTQNQALQRNSMERMLDESAPDWRQYEDKMLENLKSHPTLSSDPVTLYRLSVPPEVLESRATQSALKKLQEKTAGSQTSGVSTTRQTGTTEKGPVSFDQAIADAKAELAEQGINP